jgi:hypothetical protein
MNMDIIILVLMVEGFTLCIISCFFLTVMSVALYIHIHTAICSLCISRTRVMVMGSVSWHQNISRIGLRVSITLIYMLYGCWVIYVMPWVMHPHWHCCQKI